MPARIPRRTSRDRRQQSPVGAPNSAAQRDQSEIAKRYRVGSEPRMESPSQPERRRAASCPVSASAPAAVAVMVAAGLPYRAAAAVGSVAPRRYRAVEAAADPDAPIGN